MTTAETCRFGDGDAILDPLLFRGGDQYLEFVRHCRSRTGTW